MNEYMMNSIATHAWHEFVYCKKNNDRKAFIDGMIESYPIKLDSGEPAMVYVSDFMLPEVEGFATPDKYRVSAAAREYLSFTLVAAMVEQTIRQNELEVLNEKLGKLIKDVNRLFLSNDDMEITSIESLRNALVAGKNFYLENYYRLMETGNWLGDFNTLPISFIDYSSFVKTYKRALGISSHFGMVLDYQGSGAVVSQRAVNGLITKRIAGDSPIKVFSEPAEWKSYHDLGGMLAEDVHDYSSVDLDGSFKEHVMKLRLNNGIK